VWLDRIGGPAHGRELPRKAVEFGVRRIGSLDELDAVVGLR
jgi:putative hydrolase of the HAD superfamily